MRHDRWLMRAVKLAVLIGALGLLVEGLFELKLLVRPFVEPPSVPGQAKIIEHFLVQHIAFPVIGLLLVFAPSRLAGFAAARPATVLLGLIAVAVTIPEAIVSAGDLFRPYPFDLHSGLLERVQLLDVGGVRLNVLQAAHLACSHVALMGSVVALAIAGPPLLQRFAGPRTSR
ncbi:hypothetical protein NLX83_29610 [Allokutzneria sp. A3M-2-11 16]|uniref:hypothetical protein n=1 Tax=Allokutzneria sp. A3M-2-11 16 TaxID=2962043 RepID=UPI0020B78D12|nr:hypothetical protein [Allokutzneria sp. A3M-2-11 16]MCP3803440.1 hypothetical protein [Allokutzneria sp. A3M-2-11 16]